jgi:hypothetical protein
VLSVTSKRLWVIAGIVGASAIGVVPAITAAAYPPNKQLQASATANGNGTISVHLSNTQAGCTYIVESRGFKDGGQATGTSTDVTLTVGSKTGNYQVNVRSFGCSGPTETAHTSVGVTTFKVNGATSVKANATFPVSASGWNPDAPVVFAMTGNGKTVTSKQVTPDEDGNASTTFTAPKQPGTYVVSVVQNGSPTQSYNVTVTSDKIPQKAPKKKPVPKKKKPAPKKPAPKKPAPKKPAPKKPAPPKKH